MTSAEVLAEVGGVAPMGSHPDTPDDADAALQAVARSASRLVGRACRPLGRLASRALPGGGGTVLVVALTSPYGDLVAKLAPPAVTAAGARAQCAAEEATSGVLGGPRVPRVLGHDPVAGLVVMERATGEPLATHVARGDLAAATRAGRALAVLHGTTAGVAAQLAAGSHRAPTAADHLRDLVLPQPRQLGPCAQPRSVARSASELADAVVLAVDAVAAPLRLVHRDLHPRQVIVDGDQTWLLDWDLAAAGDPALDVGNLLGHARSRLAPAAAEAFVVAFLAGYRSHDTTRALARVAPYEAFTYLRLACKTARVRGPAGSPEVQRLLRRGRGALLAVDTAAATSMAGPPARQVLEVL
ncbi:MAG TPA: aminoglycoside phosphotransferase family protein [Dermatophilaceae bacterium]|nr:aminoglycoside phosphotransferase family protein [Dermatophilaceae bacterium]